MRREACFVDVHMGLNRKGQCSGWGVLFEELQRFPSVQYIYVNQMSDGYRVCVYIFKTLLLKSHLLLESP